MASVSYEHVTKHFQQESAAVDDLNLDIGDTEFMVLVGPSGCGKTTALRMLAGLEEIGEGQIRIGDKVVNDVPAQDRDVAMVFQSYALYPHMSVYENMAFGLKMRRISKRDITMQVQAVAEMLGLEPFLARKPGQLSGGQRQRVALGRAIVRKPQVFLLDEPLSNLDAQLRQETRVKLQQLHSDLGATFIYVTHDQVEAMTMGQRIAVMREGELQQVASPTELYFHPANMYVASFVGTPGMNLIPVTIQGDIARAAAFEVRLPRPLDVSSGVLGIRPEDIGEPSVFGDASTQLKVEVLEILGSDQFLYGHCGKDEMIARVDPHLTVAVGDNVPLGIRTSNLHVFDSQTTQALL